MSIFKCEITYNKIPNNSKISTKNKLVAHGFLEESYEISNNDFYKAIRELDLLASNKLGKDVNLYQVRNNVAIPNTEVFTEIDSINNKVLQSDVSSKNLNELENLLKSGFLKDFGITDTEYNNLKEELGLDAYSASDLITKSIAYEKGNSILPEVAYFAYSMLGKKNNKIRSDLRYLISKWDKYSERFKYYSNLIESKEGFIEDKTVWKNKIRDLVIIDYLKEQIILHYNNPQEFQKINDKSWTKDDFDLWNTIVKMLEKFLENFNRDNIKKKQKLNNLSLSIVDEILNQNYDYFDYKLKDSQILKQYTPTIKTDSFAEELVNFGQKELNIVLTGSLALRKAGTVYRTEKENLHDIDWVIPFEKINKEDLKLIESKQNSFKEESNELILPIIERQDFFKKFKAKYPTYKIINNFYGGEHKSMESLTIQGVINGEFYSEDGKHTETVSYRKKNFFTKEIEIIEETKTVDHKQGDWIKDTGYVIDFFVRLTPNQEEHENYFKLWKEIMKAKLMMGRDKDFIDWKAFKPIYSSSDKFNFYYEGYRNLNYSKDDNLNISINQEERLPIDPSNYNINIACI
jgi:hypothetical protein